MNIAARFAAADAEITKAQRPRLMLRLNHRIEIAIAVDCPMIATHRNAINVRNLTQRELARSVSCEVLDMSLIET